MLEYTQQYYIPFIITLGLFGNSISCMVFSSTRQKPHNSILYLAALAIADIGYLTSLLIVWTNRTLGWMYFDKPIWCEVAIYMSCVCGSLSAWLITAFTVERFIATKYPFKARYICTRTRTKAIIMVLIGLSMFSHSYLLWTAGVVERVDGMNICEIESEYQETLGIIRMVDGIATIVVPLTIIPVLNTLIVNILVKSDRGPGDLSWRTGAGAGPRRIYIMSR